MYIYRSNILNHKRSKAVWITLLLLIAVAGLHASSFADTTVTWLADKGLSPRLIVLIIAMVPIIELRGSIPVAILLFKIPWLEAVIISILGNMVPIPFLLLLLDWGLMLVSKVPLGAQFTNWIYERTRRKGKTIERYEAIGLITFVGIPLPGTGGWTGSLATRIFGIPFWKSMFYILLGVCLASAIVTPMTLLAKAAVH